MSLCFDNKRPDNKVFKQSLGISSTPGLVVKLSGLYLSPQLGEPSCIWPPHNPILTRPKRQNRMSGCVLQRITAVCLHFLHLYRKCSSLPLHYPIQHPLTTNRPSIGGKKNSLKMLLFLFICVLPPQSKQSRSNI